MKFKKKVRKNLKRILARAEGRVTAYHYSFTHGQDIMISGQLYRGANPKFDMNGRKIAKGIPFVKVMEK
jgi:hypothetical protein